MMSGEYFFGETLIEQTVSISFYEYVKLSFLCLSNDIGFEEQ